MSKGRTTAPWYHRGREFVVHPPGWNRWAELVFTNQNDMIEWAHGMRVILVDRTPYARRRA